MDVYDLIFEENRNRKDAIAIEYEGNEICYGELFDKIEERTEFLNSKGINSRVIDEAIKLLKEDEHKSKCPCQECVNCMCDDYQMWAGFPEPTWFKATNNFGPT